MNKTSRIKKINDFSILSGELNYFIVVYEQKSINAAARKLGLDPGNISRSIQKIEQHAQQKIFIRHKNGLTPTFFGIQFYNAIVEAQNKFSIEIQSHQHQKKIRIGFSSTIGYQYFSKQMIEHLIKGNFAPDFIVENSTKIIELLQKREIDFALIHSPVKFPGLISRPIIGEGIALASSGTDFTDTLILHPDMLAAERILYSIKHARRWYVKDYFVISKILTKNSSLMGLIPESMLQLHSSIKPLKVFSNEGKITALSWPGSIGVELLKCVEM